MQSKPSPEFSNATPPESVDVVIVGGGIVGVSTAWYLLKRGLKVAVCEKGVIAGEQSSRNWGYCRQQGRDPRELPLSIEALRLWTGLEKDIGADMGFRQSGLLYVAKDEAAMARYEAWREKAQAFQLDTRILSPKELGDFMPGCARKYPGALYTASDGRAEPALAAPSIARAVVRAGGSVLTHCAVRGYETSAGRVSAVVTEKGRIACQALVVAGGAWSSLFLRRHGVELPQLKVRSSALRTTKAPLITEACLSAPGYSIRRRADGGYTLSHGVDSTFFIVPDAFRWFSKYWNALKSQRQELKLRIGRSFFEELAMPKSWSLDEVTPFETTRILDPAPDRAILEKGMGAFKSAFPRMKDVKIAEGWAGMIDATPDALPVISRVEEARGLILSTGYSAHGFGIAPGAGKLTADIVTGDTPVVDPAPFRYSRFFDGSRLAPDEA